MAKREKLTSKKNTISINSEHQHHYQTLTLAVRTVV